MKNIKKIRQFILKKENTILIFILGLLGFSTSCEEIFSSKDEYGTPQADFIINGKVKTATSNSLISNIQVVLYSDTNYTDNQGAFTFKISEFPMEQIFLLNVKDIDGELNGSYQDTEVTVEFDGENFTGGDGDWYSGETKKDIEIKLDDKE